MLYFIRWVQTHPTVLFKTDGCEKRQAGSVCSQPAV